MAPIEGFWGKPTSTLDWCEENYAVSHYVAEFWNTISNLAMIMPSFAGFYYAYKHNIERRFMLCFMSLALVGFGSWNFHMTLLYEMQLFDELPMLWGSLMLVYALVTHLYSSFERSSLRNTLLKCSLVTYGLVCTVIYLSFKTPILFQAAYGVLVTLMLYLDICVVKFKKCNVALFYAAVGFYYGGFTLWLVDNFCCDSLRILRSTTLPIFISPFTQLHAWWHFMAGYGAYLHILFCAHSRILSHGLKLKPQFKWHAGIVLDHHQEPKPKEKKER